MKIVAPLSNVEAYRPLAEAGADEFFCGVIPHGWLERFQVTVEVMNPFRNIRYSESDFDPEWINQHAPAMSVAVAPGSRGTSGGGAILFFPFRKCWCRT